MCLNYRDACRLSFCHFFLEQNQADANFKNRFLWTDEGTFIFNRSVSAKLLGSDQMSVDTTANKFNVWAGIIGDKLIGPHFFTSKLTSDNYAKFLENDLKNLLDDAGVDITQIWFQQNGIAVHRSKKVIECIDTIFGSRWIGNQGMAWPPNSYDLTPMNFFLWKYIEYRLRISGECFENISELIQWINAEFGALKRQPDKIAELHDNMVERCTICISKNGKSVNYC